MKHQSSRRRQGRRHADPSVICLPSQSLPYTPPRKEPEVGGSAPTAMTIPDDDVLDAELLAHRNIFETMPRMSRQARRKAMRAERKAARRAVTERFLEGAPSLGEAAQQFSIAAMPEAIVSAAPVAPELLVADLEADLEADTEIDEPVEMEAMAAAEDEPVPLEEIAQMISATGPLIVPSLEDALRQAVLEAETCPELAPLPFLRKSEDASDREIASQEPAEQIAIEQMTTPLPRNRALVPARRGWLMRLVPWRRNRHIPAPEPALAQLQELRFELAMTLRRLDQIIDTLPESVAAH
jgi:hypothetical protein